MEAVQALIDELETEAAATKAALERVPADKLDYRPCGHALTLGQLALHIASAPGGVAEMLAQDVVDMPEMDMPAPEPGDDLVAMMEQGVAAAKTELASWTPEKANGLWRVLKSGVEVMAMPRLATARAMLLNHWYHHRGQLTVYFMHLGVPVPAIYGPSIDEDGGH